MSHLLTGLSLQKTTKCGIGFTIDVSLCCAVSAFLLTEQVLQRHEVGDLNLCCVRGHSRKNRDRLFGRHSNYRAAERKTWAEQGRTQDVGFALVVAE